MAFRHLLLGMLIGSMLACALPGSCGARKPEAAPRPFTPRYERSEGQRANERTEGRLLRCLEPWPLCYIRLLHQAQHQRNIDEQQLHLGTPAPVGAE
jgi:hypothetical protein